MDNYICLSVVIFFVVSGLLEEVHSFGTAYQENGEHLMTENKYFSNDVSEFPSQNWAESTSRQRITPKGSRGTRLKQRTKSRSALLGYVPLSLANNPQEEPLQQLKVKRSTDGELRARQIESKHMETDSLKANSIRADNIVSHTVITKNIDVRSKKNRLVERRSFEGAQESRMTRTRPKHSRRPSHKASELKGNIGIDHDKVANSKFQLSSNDKLKSLILQPLPTKRDSWKRDRPNSSIRSRNKWKGRRRPPQTPTEMIGNDGIFHNKVADSNFQLSSNDQMKSLTLQPLPTKRDSRKRDRSNVSTRSRITGKRRRRPPQTPTEMIGNDGIFHNKVADSNFQLSPNDKIKSLTLQPLPTKQDSRKRDWSNVSTRSRITEKRRRRPPQTPTEMIGNDGYEHADSNFQVSSNRKSESILLQPLKTQQDSMMNEQPITSTRFLSKATRQRRPPQTPSDLMGGNIGIEHNEQADDNFQILNGKSRLLLLQQDSTINGQHTSSTRPMIKTKLSPLIEGLNGKNNAEQRFHGAGTDKTGRPSVIRNSGRNSRRNRRRKSRLTRIISENLSGNPSGNNDRQPSYRTVDTIPSGDTFVNPRRYKKQYRPTDPPLDFVEQDEITKQNMNGLLEADTISAGSIKTVHMQAGEVNADKIKSKTINAKTLTVQPNRPVNLALYESTSVSGKQTNTFIKPKSPTYEIANPILNVRPEKTTMQASEFIRNRYEKRLGRQRLNIDRHPTAPENLINLEMLGISNTGQFAPERKMFIEPTVTKEKIRVWDKKKNINSNSANLRRSNPTEYVGDNYKSFHKYSNVFNDSFMF
ncbi:unnamed protein product [Mytilus coruscus]|uniref:Uncharacterized protein n=1 Tax=Mytilus coruscus TaxID=42192 RepID=A0A6J8AAK1_MYTCO|nr:unnamed protein product [Mytilus coruscus]